MDGGQQSLEGGRVKGAGEGLEQAKFVDDQRAAGVAVKGGKGNAPVGGSIEGPWGTRGRKGRKGGRGLGVDLEENGRRGVCGRIEDGVEESLQCGAVCGVPETVWAWSGGWRKIA